MGGSCGKSSEKHAAFPRRGWAARVVDACVCRVSDDTGDAWVAVGAGPDKSTASLGGEEEQEPPETVRYDSVLMASLLQPQREGTIVFIFGGPGSKKGIFVENLLQTFGFRLVSTEDIILRHLPGRIEDRARREGLVFSSQTSSSTQIADGPLSKAADGVAKGDSPPAAPSSTPTWYSRGPSATTFAHKVKLMLQDYPDELTLQWIMDHIVEEINSAKMQGHTLFLVDMLPNFDFMYVHSFSRLDCSREMKWLEKQFPNFAIFSILLSISNEDFEELFNGMNDYAPEATDLNITSEIDIGQIKRRQSSFLAAMRPYFEYFRKTGRIVDVTPAKAKFDYTWQRLRQVLSDLKFSPRSAAEIVIIFTGASEEMKTKSEKWQKKGLKQKKLSTMADLQKEFKMYCSGKSTHRLIICDTKLCQFLPKSDEKMKLIRFMEDGDTMSELALDKDASCSCQKIMVDSKGYRTISCPGNVVCFFPARMDESTCRLTAAQIANMLRQQERN